jgi:pilus assembly protein CpaE
VQLSIIILAAERTAVQSMANALTAPGHGVTIVTRPDEAVAAAAGYSVLIIDGMPPPATLADVVTMLRSNEATVKLPVLAVAQTSNLDETIALLEAGADDVIAKPYTEAELLSRLDALALRAQSTATIGDGKRAIGQKTGHSLVSVFSPKGGVGTTTVAVNLAVIAAEARPNQVLLIDLDLSFGQVASHLNLQPKQTLLELIRDSAALTETDLFRTYTIHHPSGLNILAAPPSPTFASMVTAEHVEAVLARAMEAFELVIIDAGTALDYRLQTIFSLSETVVVPVLPEIPALNSVHVLLDQLSDSGALGGHTVFVLNNAFARELLKRSDIETALGHKLSADLPYDPIVYLKAVNEGNPVVRSAPKTPPAEKLRALGALVFGGLLTPAGSVPVAPVAAPKEKRGLFGRR